VPLWVAVRSLGPVFRNLSSASLAEVACAPHRKMNYVVGLASAISSLFSLLSSFSLLLQVWFVGYTWSEYIRPDLSMDVLIWVCKSWLEYRRGPSTACCQSVDSTLLLDSWR
jgi:hypothetical protein